MKKISCKTVRKGMVLLILAAFLLTQFFGLGALQSRVYAVDGDILSQESLVEPAGVETAIEEESDAANEDDQKNLMVYAAEDDSIDFMEDSLKNSLRMYLSFNENTNDITGKITTQPIGTMEYVDGMKGKALRLNGTNYVSLGNLTYGQDSFTFAFWERSAPNPGGDTSFISNKDWASGNNIGYVIGIDDKVDGNGNYSTMWFNIAPARHDVRDATDSKLKIADNTWHYVVGVVDRTNGNLLMYIDGKSVKSSSISGLNGNSIDSGLPTIIGADGKGNYKTKTDMDEVALFNRALTEAEVVKLTGYYIDSAVSSDKTHLASVIAEAQKLYDNSANADAGLKTNFKTAIDNSTAVYNDEQAEQTQVDNGVKALYTAIRTFKGVKMSFDVLSDIHISKTSSTNAANARFTNALKDIQLVDETSKALVIAGDVTDNGSAEEYDVLNSILLQNAHPDMYYIVGNHDVRYMGPEAFDRFKDKTGMSGIYYDQLIDGYQFIFLGTEQNLKDAAYISEEQFKWLEEKLQKADENKPVFLFLHQPIYGLLPGTARWNETDWIIQQVKLRKLLGQYPQTLFFTGHTHYSLQTCFKYDEKYCTMFNTGGTYYLENAETYGGASGSQGLYVEVYDGKVVVRGREFTNNTWIDKAEHTVHFPVEHFPPVDLEKPQWSQDSEITVLEKGENSASIAWSEASDNVGVTQYSIYSEDVIVATVSGDINQYKLTALRPGKEYSIKIAALDEEENQSDFLTAKITTEESSVQDTLDFLDENLRDSLKAYLSFNGHNADITEKNNTQSVGTMEYVDGKKGKALKLDGSNYISLGNITYGQESFSFAFWEKSTPPANDTAFISNKDWNSGSNAGWVIGHDDKDRSNMWFNLASPGVKRYDARGHKIADDLWHYIAVSVDRSKAQVTIYVDGTVASVTDISEISGNSIDSGLPTVIGADGMGNYKVTGLIDEMAIFGKALSEQEVKLLMLLDKPAYEIASAFKIAYDNDGHVAEKEVSSISECKGKYVNVYVNVTNNRMTAKEMVIVAVSYGKDGAMLNSVSNHKIIDAAETESLEAGILVSEKVAEIKVFVLDGAGYKGIFADMTYAPLTDSLVLK